MKELNKDQLEHVTGARWKITWPPVKKPPVKKPPVVTTMMVGEEGGPIITTLALGEEGGSGGGMMTTMAVGEEDGTLNPVPVTDPATDSALGTY